MPRPSQIFYLFIFCGLFTCAQCQPPAQAPPSDTRPANNRNAAVVTFTLDFPSSQPEHYSIRVPLEGPAHYESNGRISPDSDATDNFNFEFTLSPETQAKILALAAKAGFFEHDLDSHRKGLAFTGKKTLTYKDANHAGESTYNVPKNAAAQQLTDLFQNLSATLEFGHRLDYDRRYQKLALDEELKRMEEMARDNLLSEVAAVRPILEQIVADQSIVNVARVRAQRLLEASGTH
jgi:hypothetical protein